MTISSYIVEFLKLYEGIEIETNHVPDGSDKNGLFKSPTREVSSKIDGSKEITEHYQFLARQASVEDVERKESDEWLEDLTYWIDDFSFNYAYPDIDKNRTITDISVTGIPAPLEYQEDDIVYQISLSITYTRESEVI